MWCITSYFVHTEKISRWWGRKDIYLFEVSEIGNGMRLNMCNNVKYQGRWHAHKAWLPIMITIIHIMKWINTDVAFSVPPIQEGGGFSALLFSYFFFLWLWLSHFNILYWFFYKNNKTKNNRNIKCWRNLTMTTQNRREYKEYGNGRADNPPLSKKPS